MTQSTGEEPDILKEITELYCYYKELSLFADELRTESFLPPINEIRDAFDHLMRTCAVDYGFKKENGNYKQENLKATFRHLYRAVFDLLDYIRIYQKEAIYEKTKGFSRTAIFDVFPEYYRDIVPEIERCVKTIPIYKMDKDIGDPDLSAVKNYVDLVKTIREYSLTIDEKIPAIIAYEEKIKSEQEKIKVEQEKEKRKDNWVKLIIGIIGALVGGGLLYLFTHL